ncbi:MAG: hypothetical protein K0R59_140 [Sphingobacterium sp.]|jgi:hypothetical protein|nr:hypothetical protein [Sphingobacterium sp.]
MPALLFQLSTSSYLWQLLVAIEFVLKIYTIYILLRNRKLYRPHLLATLLVIFFVPLFGNIIFLITHRDIKKNNNLI